MTNLSPPPTPAPHPPPETLHLYSAGGLGPASAVSIELHLDRCPACRGAVNAESTSAAAARLESNWFMIAAELDAPRRGVIERALGRLGAPRDVVRLMAATPSLRRAWFVAALAALFFGVAATNPDRVGSNVVLFLVLAPLIPVIGVALAYGPGVDPSYEISVAAPLSGFRLLMVRTAAVLATSIVLGGAASLLLVRREGLIVVAWMLPGLALSLACLALTTLVRPRVAAAIVSIPWLLIVLTVSDRAADRLVLFRGASQVVMAVLAVASAVVVVMRRRAFDVAGEVVS